MLHRRTALERECMSSASLVAALYLYFLLADTLGRGDLHVCICVSRAVCIRKEFEFFQVPFSWNFYIIQYNMYIYNTFESAFEVSENFRGSYAAWYMHEPEQRKLQDCSLAQRQYSTRFAPTCRYEGEMELLKRCIKADEIGGSLSRSHSPRWTTPGAMAERLRMQANRGRKPRRRHGEDLEYRATIHVKFHK